uniref:Uncharacterized protein n=1 Tax=Cucumis melo TaxID=3656 RepID=A0A9I9EIB7_CUCME
NIHALNGHISLGSSYLKPLQLSLHHLHRIASLRSLWHRQNFVWIEEILTAMAVPKFLPCKQKFYLPFAMDFHTLSRREFQALREIRFQPISLMSPCRHSCCSIFNLSHFLSCSVHLLILDC